MTPDLELHSFRRGYYEMLVALFRTEPTAELLQQLSNGIEERTRGARNLHPLLGQGWEEIQRFLTNTPYQSLAETVSDEYTRLFIGPHGPEINPYESFYLTGRLLDRPLADVRTCLKAIGIEKLEQYPEPEDCLAFELEVMRWLIAKQLAAIDPQEETRLLDLQSNFLKDHLLVWAPACAKDIERAEGASFYHSLAKILEGFLEIELNFFRERGLGKITSLDAARQRYGALPVWKGPTFDISGDEKSEDKPEAPPSGNKNC